MQLENNKTARLTRRDFLKSLAAVGVFTAVGRALPFNLAAGAFEFLVVGDSLIFGQGLLDKDKIFNHIAEWLRTSAPGAPQQVNVKMKAHSGSTLKFHADEAEAYRKAGRDETYYYKPEVNVSFPSTWKQIEVAASEYKAEGKTGADLIVLSGSITDITVAKVLNPKGDDELLKRQVKQYSHDDMLEVLHHAARLHPETAIAVIGYFPMVSPKSNGKRLLNGWLEAEDTPRFKKWLMNNPISRKLFFQKIGDKAVHRARLYLELSNTHLQAAVDDFNKSFDRPRAVFVKTPFTEDNAVEAPDTLVFRMGKKGIPEDPVYLERKVDCDQSLTELKRATGLDYPIRFCEVAGVGHPNPAGARKYADSVIAALPSLLARRSVRQ